MRWSRLWRRLTLVIFGVSLSAVALIVALLDAMRDWNDNLFVALAVLGPTGLVVLLVAGVFWAMAGLKSRRRQAPAARWLVVPSVEPSPKSEIPPGKPRARWIVVVPRPSFSGPLTTGPGV